MTSIKPYLIPAIYNWIIDNDLTPHILVDANCPGTEVPANMVDNGQIVLNIRPGACERLELGNEAITFNTRFSGRKASITAPMGSIMAIYAKENGQGMIFDRETPQEPKAQKKPALRIVK